MTTSIATTAQAATTENLPVASPDLATAQFGLENLLPPQYMPYFSFLSQVQVFGNSLLQYIFAILVSIIAFIIIPIVWKIFTKYLSNFVATVKPDIKDLLATQLSKFNYKIFVIAAIYVGALTLNLPTNIFIAIKGVFLALVGIQIAIIIGPLLEPLIKSIPALNKPELRPITARVVMLSKTSMWAVVGLFSLSSLGLDTTPLLGGLGVLGLGGALAFQNMMPGFIKILSFHFSKTFSIGDKISAGSHQGIVEEIDISTSKIKQANGDIVDVKNEELLTAIVIPSDGPHFISETIKLNLDIKNENQTFVEIENIFKKSLGSIVDSKFERVIFTDFKGSGIICDLNYSVLIDKKIVTRHNLISNLLHELKEKNISFTGV